VVGSFIGILWLFIMISLFYGLQYESGDRKWCANRFFKTHIMDIFDIRFKKEWLITVCRHVIIIIFPPYFLYKPMMIGIRHNNIVTKYSLFIIWIILYYLLVFLVILASVDSEFFIFAVVQLFIIFTTVAVLRYHYRMQRNIAGSVFLDWMCGYICTWSTLDQLYMDCRHEQLSSIASGTDDYSGKTPPFSRKMQSDPSSDLSLADYKNRSSTQNSELQNRINGSDVVVVVSKKKKSKKKSGRFKFFGSRKSNIKPNVAVQEPLEGWKEV
jgi:hypothetical protein